jgi:hypothetical protein
MELGKAGQEAPAVDARTVMALVLGEFAAIAGKLASG